MQEHIQFLKKTKNKNKKKQNKKTTTLSSGSGRFIRRWVILEITKDFITVILPKGVRFLLDQAFSTFFISFSLFSKLIVIISSTSVENTTPRTVNVTGFQSRLISGINLNFEFLRDHIHTAIVLSTLMFRPDIEANCCKTHMYT